MRTSGRGAPRPGERRALHGRVGASAYLHPPCPTEGSQKPLLTGPERGRRRRRCGRKSPRSRQPWRGKCAAPHPHPWVGGARLSLVMTLSGALLVNRTTPSGDGAPPLTRGRRAGCTLRFGHRKKQRNVSEELSAHWPANTCRSGREKAFSALSLSAPWLWVSPQPRCRAARPTRRGRAGGEGAGEDARSPEPRRGASARGGG